MGNLPIDIIRSAPEYQAAKQYGEYMAKQAAAKATPANTLLGEDLIDAANRGAAATKTKKAMAAANETFLGTPFSAPQGPGSPSFDSSMSRVNILERPMLTPEQNAAAREKAGMEHIKQLPELQNFSKWGRLGGKMG